MNLLADAAHAFDITYQVHPLNPTYFIMEIHQNAFREEEREE